MRASYDLDSLPTKGVFRLRGTEMSRLETFADAAFAFALTLLVISIDEIPSNFKELAEALKAVPAFAASFAILIMFWLGHRTWSQRYGLDDPRSTFLTLLLVFTIMVYVYPLRVLMTEAMNTITGGWVPSSFAAESFLEVRLVFIIYSSGWTVASLAILMLFQNALKRREELRLNELEVYETRAEVGAWSILAGTGLVSIAMASLGSGFVITMSGWVYAMLGIIMPVYANLSYRRRQRLFGR